MESGGGHEDKEGDKPVEDGSSSRYYECVFCKQGFTTAQALGGHMNIHRRERARNRQPPTSSHDQHLENYSSSRPAHSRPSSTHLPRYSKAQETPSTTGYNMYLPPSSSSSTRHPHPSSSHTHIDHQSRPSFNVSGEDHYTNLSLQLGYKEEEKNKQYDQEEDEVDLELRLGHDP